MKRNKKKLISMILCVVMILSVSFCCASCAKKDVSFKTEDFHYKIVNDKIIVISLTLEGQTKEEIIIPPYVNGKKIHLFSVLRRSPVFSEFFTDISSDELIRFYAPYTLNGINGFSNSDVSCVNGEKLKYVFYPSNKMFERTEFTADELPRVFSPPPTKSYVTLKSYNYLVEKFTDNIYLERISPANVSYLFNYEDSPNDNYYFIDHAEELSVVRNAPAPMREGYEFAGWYKEVECLNAWNFETDVTPAALYDENEKEIYQETKLYAKWEA